MDAFRTGPPSLGVMTQLPVACRSEIAYIPPMMKSSKITKKKRPRLHLRPPEPGDMGALIRMGRESRALHEPWVSPPDTPEKYRQYLARTRLETHRGFLLCREEEVVGVFNVNEIVRGGFQSAYLGYYGSSGHAGKGYMTEGMRGLLRHLFLDLKLHRVEANIQPGNRTSIRLVKRCGFRLEGFSPRYLKIRGRWRDHERWAMTKEDFASTSPPGSPPSGSV